MVKNLKPYTIKNTVEKSHYSRQVKVKFSLETANISLQSLSTSVVGIANYRYER